MKSQGALGKFERLYLALTGGSLRHVVAFVWTFSVGAAIQFLQAPTLWWVLGAMVVMTLLVLPFLSGLLRFSPAMREHRKKRDEERQATPVGWPGDAIATGAAMTCIGLLSVRLENPYFRHFLIYGPLLLVGGIIALLIVCATAPRRGD